MNKHNQPTIQELRELFPEASEEQIAAIFSIFERQSILSPDEPIYISECSMCGREMSHRACGMCVHCEQVWNS